jgi:hypothetical protein
MISFRFVARGLVATALICGVVVEAESQTANSGRPKTTAEMARDIARTITDSASSLNAPNGPIFFVSALSRDNIVEVKYVTKDNAIFAGLKSSSDQMRLGKSSYYCNEARISYLKQGIVIQEIIITSNNGDQFDFTFDKSSCEGLPKAKLADSTTLAELALTVAKVENEANKTEASGKPLNFPFQFNGATAHQGIVDERFIVRVPSTRASVQANRGNMEGFVRGYLCSKYRDFIFKGIAFHHFFVLADDSPVIDFTIDRSNC